jgi:hypothetical protein
MKSLLIKHGFQYHQTLIDQKSRIVQTLGKTCPKHFTREIKYYNMPIKMIPAIPFNGDIAQFDFSLNSNFQTY